jgi:hypothetical protein
MEGKYLTGNDWKKSYNLAKFIRDHLLRSKGQEVYNSEPLPAFNPVDIGEITNSLVNYYDWLTYNTHYHHHSDHYDAQRENFDVIRAEPGESLLPIGAKKTLYNDGDVMRYRFGGRQYKEPNKYTEEETKGIVKYMEHMIGRITTKDGKTHILGAPLRSTACTHDGLYRNLEFKLYPTYRKLRITDWNKGDEITFIKDWNKFCEEKSTAILDPEIIKTLFTKTRRSSLPEKQNSSVRGQSAYSFFLKHRGTKEISTDITTLYKAVRGERVPNYVINEVMYLYNTYYQEV